MPRNKKQTADLEEGIADRELEDMRKASLGSTRERSAADVGDFLLERCTGDYSKLFAAARALKVQIVPDFLRYTAEEILEKGASREAVGALEEALKVVNPDWHLKRTAGEIKDSGYIRESPAVYRLTNYNLERTETGVMVNGYGVSASKNGLSGEQLYDMFKLAKNGRSTIKIASKLGISDSCIRQHLRAADILVRSVELKERGLI
ncbi:MAG: hypothetical protein Q7R87_01245 [Nanoarchaeota archaeon]|nr:hypothetical protein [Nanoarchaeota archaeon]